MRQREKELEAKNVKIVVVTFEVGSPTRAYLKETNLTWPLLVDETRELYQAYDMLTAGFWDIWGPASWWAYLKEISKGKWPKKSSGDISQRGGDVLIDPNGIIRLHHIGIGPSDRPDVQSVIEMIS